MEHYYLSYKFFNSLMWSMSMKSVSLDFGQEFFLNMLYDRTLKPDFTDKKDGVLPVA